MLTRRTVLAASAIAVLTRRGVAASPGPAVAGQAAAVARASVVPVQDQGSISDRMEQFIDTSGLGARADRNELFILKAVSNVAVLTTNPDWVRYRQMAYSDALLKAQADFVASQSEHITSTTVHHFYKSAGEQPPPYDDTRAPGQAAELLRKLLAVADGKVDGQLRALGIDPSQYAKTPEPQRTPLLVDSLKTTTLKQAVGDTIGLCPVQTFEDWDKEGNTQIGVVAVSSPIMHDFAQQVLTMRGEFTPDPKRAQDLRKLFADTRKLVSEFGVRRLFDARGLPVIVSFAQWASPYRGGDPAFAAEYNESAFEQAKLLADSQIADFLKGSIDYKESGTIGRTLERVAVSLPSTSGGAGEVEEIKKAIDELRRHVIRMASIEISGQRTLRSWSGRHPAANLPIVGVIRMWSAATERAMHMRDAPPVTSAASTYSAAPPGTAEGQQLMSPDDF